MNEATVRLVEELSTKLGTTAEHLWAVLIRQAPISGTCMVLMFVVLIVALMWTFHWARTKTRQMEDPRDVFTIWFVWGVLVCIMVVMALTHASDIAASFINPEYWALRQVLPKP